MKWHKLVFSDEPRLRFRRHTLFWLAWLFYFTASFFYKQQPFMNDEWLRWAALVLFKSILLLFGHAFICYTTICFLLPQFLLKGRYFSFTGTLLTAGIIVTAWTYLCYAVFFPFFDTTFHSSTAVTPATLLWNSILAGLLSSLKLVAVAITIKILKRWWQKQNENMQLEKEKIRVELQLLKAQIHPEFLFSSLDSIYDYTQNNSVKASESLLKLSDMLSYMLYECDQSFVPLEKEIRMIRDYMELEKKRLGDKLDMDIRVTGEPGKKIISPLLLLPFIENSFHCCENKDPEKCWINLDIRINEHDFFLKLINGKSPVIVVSESLSENGLCNVQKRLDMIYKDSYELKITAEPDFMITYLKIQLDKSDKWSEEKLNHQNHIPAYVTT